MAKPKATSSFPSASKVAAWVVEDSLLFRDEASPFRAALRRGAVSLVVVTGENASGKSLFVRIAAEFVRKEGILPVSVSVRERTGTTGGEMSGLARVMMFGDEREQSTGATSVSAVRAALNNLERPKGSLLICDEPEMGLSEGYARALGVLLGQGAKSLPARCRGVLVATHSRPLVRGIIEGLGRAPTHVACSCTGSPWVGLEHWLEEDEHRSVEDLEALQEAGLERFRQVAGLLRES